uniref:AT14266p n=1 Tax=Drosophila melanogaster TaxID=7227 RepID=Q8T978_DROME|nr:AT14266p [Drosophila melanogaster]
MGRMETSVRLGGALQRLLVGIVVRTQPALRLKMGCNWMSQLDERHLIIDPPPRTPR